MSKISKYGKEDLQEALRCIRENKLNIRQASSHYNIPRSTLQAKLKGKRPEGIGKPGPGTVLSTQEELEIKKWITDMAKCGFPLRREQLLDTVQKIILDDGRPSPFVEGRPSRKWFDLFLKRHPDIAVREPEGITKGRASVTERFIRNWFEELKIYLEEIGQSNILNDPSRIFNADETSFCLCPKTGKVLAPKGCKNILEIKSGSDRENVTVLLTFSASGEIVTPLVVFPYIRPPPAVLRSIPSNWQLGLSPSGWMRSETFLQFIKEGFNNWILEKKITKPVLLLLDGHRSHLHYDTSVFCNVNDIILYSLPPNTTHVLQPADVSVFKPLKTEWKKTVIQWQASEDNTNCVTKVNFCSLLQHVLKKDNLSITIQNGFRKCGLYPFDPNAVDYSKCVRDTLEEINRHTVVRASPDSSRYILGEDAFEIAKTVIEFIKQDLSQKNINAEEVLNAIDRAKTSLKKSDEEDQSQASQCSPPTEIQMPGKDHEINSVITNQNREDSVQKNEQTKKDDQEYTLPDSLAAAFSDLAPGTYDLSIDGTVVSDILMDIQNSPESLPVPNFESTPRTSLQGKSKGSSTSLQKFLVAPKTRKVDTFFKSKRKLNLMPSAISSPRWQNLYISKENEKENYNTNRKRGKTDNKRTQDKKRKGSRKIKCTKCNDDLISDVEDDDLKNVGCDQCIRWFHLKCTHFKTYMEALTSEFTCDYCKEFIN